MQLRFRLLLLAALVIVVVAGSVAACEETKPLDSSEATSLEADGEKSKKQRDDIQLDSGKARVKQKWQRYKKAKKAALRKEKAPGKTGKEKWKAAAEEVRGKKSKRYAQYVDRDSESRQKLTKKDKVWKEGKEERLGVEKRQPSGEGKRSNAGKVRRGLKVTGKWTQKGESSVCAKDELCSSGSENSVGSEKKKWKRKKSDEESRGEKSIKLNKAGDEDLGDGTESVNANGRIKTKSDKNTGEGEHNDVLKQRTPEGGKPAAESKGTKSPEAAPAVQPESPEVYASKLKAAKVHREEDADGALEEDVAEGVRKNSSGNRKVLRSYIVEEEYNPDCNGCSDRSLTDDMGGIVNGNWNTVRSLSGQSRVRRYIVEEEIIEENADGEQGATDGDEKSRFMW